MTSSTQGSPAAITAAGEVPTPLDLFRTPEPTATTPCPAGPGDHRWQMTIVEGSVVIACSGCGNEPFPDYEDLVVLAPIPVQIEEVPDHRDGRCPLPLDVTCDCGSELVVTLTSSPA
ncbi:hypothetical protein [Frankia sp. AgB32]|uniref:hypothetical protein n=1 Tax=Frankia sp. AgB32 TaxID=631119 RepID=UPI00200E1BE1|nr:hypothetical protein [Frankia sp. AgB32]MCK9894730.1 hypothetical protein [Frankia sp. AgB32]